MQKPDRIAGREQVEPDELNNPIPWPFAIFAAAIFVWASVYYFWQDDYPMTAGDQRTPVQQANTDQIDGATVYAGNCAACHQGNGQGLPSAFPPLDGSEWVVGDDNLVAQILLHGMSGEIAVAGVTYNGVMPSFAQLSDAELAAVATYIRGHWSNQAAAVSAADIAAQRELYPERAPWAGGAELRSTVADPGVHSQ